MFLRSNNKSDTKSKVKVEIELMPLSPFGKCPDEVLLEVFSQLDIVSFTNLSMTSKRFKKLSENNLINAAIINKPFDINRLKEVMIKSINHYLGKTKFGLFHHASGDDKKIIKKLLNYLELSETTDTIFLFVTAIFRLEKDNLITSIIKELLDSDLLVKTKYFKVHPEDNLSQVILHYIYNLLIRDLLPTDMLKDMEAQNALIKDFVKLTNNIIYGLNNDFDVPEALFLSFNYVDLLNQDSETRKICDPFRDKLQKHHEIAMANMVVI